MQRRAYVMQRKGLCHAEEGLMASNEANISRTHQYNGLLMVGLCKLRQIAPPPSWIGLCTDYIIITSSCVIVSV